MRRTIGRDRSRGLEIESLPYEIAVYVNNQVLIPARLVKKLGIGEYWHAVITIEYRGRTETFKARLLRTRNTLSRQFTIPKEVRSKLGIEAGSVIRVLKIEPVD